MLTWIEAEGSPEQIGYRLGCWGRQACHDHLLSSPAWHTIMRWRESDAIRVMGTLVDQHFPWIAAELDGLAKGLGLPYEDVLLWNCRGDLWAMAPDGCTTVLAPGRLTHNEDGDPGFNGRCGIAHVQPTTAPAFVSFVYPGSIPGHTFAVTDAGLAMTVNNVRAHAVALGLPRMVLTRAILAQPSMSQACELLRSLPRAGAFHLGLGQTGANETLSIEFASQGLSIETVTTPRLHANHANHTALHDLPQTITASSRQRQLRGDALINAQVPALSILADQQDNAEPIYRRHAHDTDNENTQATADIVFSGPIVTWSIYAHPEQAAHFQLQGLQRV
ncbi:C45 family peptidase [Alcaligenaceae bacterium CGII-47]|nr:C45 family peptidase [Alcaligenaceae bacterium CGII-47]